MGVVKPQPNPETVDALLDTTWRLAAAETARTDALDRKAATVAPSEAGSRLQFTIDVDDVDATCSELASRGVQLLNGPTDRPWGVRTASFRDPGGHIWEIAHSLASR